MNRLGFLGLIVVFPILCLGQGLTISTIAGAGFSPAPLPAPAVNEGLDDEEGVAVDSAGNVYFGGGVDNVVYKISGGVLSVVAGARYKSGYSGDGGPATSALLNNPQGVAVDSMGNLYIADYQNYVVRKASAGGVITTIAGNGTYGTLVTGPATRFQPIGVAVDVNQNFYVGCGTAGGYILKITNGTLSIAAGIGNLGSGSVTNGAQATTQPVASPHFLAVDSAGNVYITSQYFGAVFELNTASGIITVAGNGNSGYSGDGAPATGAAMLPLGVAVDSSGNIFIANTGNGAIREVSNGIINTIASRGQGSSCSSTSASATSLHLNNPAGIAAAGGNIYFGVPNCIEEMTAATTSGPPSITTGGIVSASAFGIFTSVAPGSWIEIYGSNLAADTRSWATADFQGANAPTSLSPGQVNAQVPSNVATGSQSVILKTPSGTAPIFHGQRYFNGTWAAGAQRILNWR